MGGSLFGGRGGERPKVLLSGRLRLWRAQCPRGRGGVTTKATLLGRDVHYASQQTLLLLAESALGVYIF